MATSTLLQVMSGIETQLKTISGLRTAPFLADQINPPQAMVDLPTIPNYRETFTRAKFTFDVPVHILVGAVVDRMAQPLLATFADVTGTNSIPAAIEADRTLGGVVDDAIVVDFRPLHREEVNAIGYIGGVFTVRVIARGI